MADAAPVSVCVSYRGAPHAVALPRDATLAALGGALAAACGAAPHTLRLLMRGGRALALGDDAARGTTLREAGLPTPARLMLLGSSAAELEALAAAPAAAALQGAAAREAPPGHAAAVAARRRGRGPPQPIALPTGAYVFAAFQAIPSPPGLALTPSPAAALRLLHRLAADVGIARVMAARRWRVGLLSEMPPEGKVGVSESCVLGYNVNQGQEIALRLRTDDWRGFRRYERIRETLLHELAHMVHSAHDIHFKTLNSALTVEAAAADWTRRGARTLGGGGGAWEGEDWEDAEAEDASVMGVTARDSGKPLGGAGELRGRSALGAAAVAAQRRAAAAAAAAAEAAMAAEAEAALGSVQLREGSEGDDAPMADAGAEAAAAAPAAPPQPETAAPQAVPPVEPAAAPLAAPPPPPLPDGAADDAAAWAAASGDDPELSRVAASARAAASRAAAAAAQLAAGCGGASAAEGAGALRTLAEVLRNALAHPGAPRFRVLRRGNAAFEARAGRFPAAIELLRAAGFVEEAEPGAAAAQPGGDAVRRLRLARDDPGLLWLALSAVNDALEARGGAPQAAGA